MLQTAHKRAFAALVILRALLVLAVPPGAVAESPVQLDFVGSWRGTLNAGEYRLRLVFDVRQADDGELEATLDSPDQGITGIPVAVVTVEADSIRFELTAIGALYSGRLVQEGRVIDGEWHQSGQAFPLAVERASGGE